MSIRAIGRVFARTVIAAAIAASAPPPAVAAPAGASTSRYEMNDSHSHFKVYDMYQPLWALLTKEASEKVRKGNYERIFDEGRRDARAWEAANPNAGQ